MASDSVGRLVRASMARPRIVLISESPSAPAASTARAEPAMSQLAGESFAQSGFVVAARQAATLAAALSAASSTFGQERLSSSASTSGQASSSAQSPLTA